MKINSHYRQENIVTLLYGCKIGEPSYMEEILYECEGYVNKDKLMEKGKQWAEENNYNRLKIKGVLI